MQELFGSFATALAAYKAPDRSGGKHGEAPDVAQAAEAAACPGCSRSAETGTAELCLHPQLLPYHPK